VPVIGVDLYPTLCQIAGLKLPTDQPLGGVSLMPLLTGEGDLPQRALYWHFPAYLQSYSRKDQQRDPLYRSRPCGIIRRGDWKLHEYFENGDLELYNLRTDIGEANNLASTHPEKAAELLEQLRAWRQATGAPVPRKPNPDYDPDAERAKIESLSQRK
jgi:arylsulfatase A-like enzyme